MRKLTFKGFLTKYVKELSYSATLDMATLAPEAVLSNPRLRAPLVLYAVTSQKEALLQKHLPDRAEAQGMRAELASLSRDDFEKKLRDGRMPNEYLKVWHSFLVAQNAHRRDDELKAKMRHKVLQLQKINRCSNYRAYTDLKLNPGNINCWLKTGDSSKVSYDTAKRVMDFVQNYRPL